MLRRYLFLFIFFQITATQVFAANVNNPCQLFTGNWHGVWRESTGICPYAWEINAYGTQTKAIVGLQITLEDNHDREEMKGNWLIHGICDDGALIFASAYSPTILYGRVTENFITLTSSDQLVHVFLTRVG